MRFHDRRDGGTRLAARVEALGLDRPVVLALPRGGVPVAYEVALRLRAPLDVFVARKLGAPRHPELGIGALAEGGTGVVDDHSLAALHVRTEDLDRIVAVERRELDRRVRRYRGDRPLLPVADQDVVLVDDGLATGVTARAAIEALRRGSPRRLVLAVPVCPRQAAAALSETGTEVVCVLQPDNFQAVGAWYDDFAQTTDDEVLELLAAAADWRPAENHA
jgi:putative phosphoribosyl transferase